MNLRLISRFQLVLFTRNTARFAVPILSFSSTATAVKVDRVLRLLSYSLAADTLRRLTRLPLASHVRLLSNGHAVEIDAASASVSLETEMLALKELTLRRHGGRMLLPLASPRRRRR
ncbi:hypothetical protein NDU88_004310 [Pleurodeles waltl]|uniref:Uncharacterized protein n=1 Tax=Pleurodeles waltl TaxID=8319 RepID=A0AAV7SIF2_PLEWA|nr:hypothetical protein NDU88_004310 [Pleurodeles waltl]